MEIMLKDKNGVILHTTNKYCKEDINVSVDTERITITPSSEKQVKEGLFDQVVVSPVNLANFTSDATVKSENILEGKTAYVNGEKITGTLPNNGELEYTPSDELQIVPEGYTSGGIVSAADITTLNEYNECLNIANSILGGAV